MITTIYRSILFFAVSIVLAGCVSVIDATTDKPIQIDPGKRSLGGIIDDKKLRTVIAVNIKKSHETMKDAHINVHSYNGVVLLTGEVQTTELRKLAGVTARKVNRVRQVYNELSVGPKTSFLSRTKDNWLQSKIKSKLVFNQDIESRRVKIIVEDNVVYLMGLLSKIQTEKITEIVRQTRGVSKVVRAIEYID